MHTVFSVIVFIGMIGGAAATDVAGSADHPLIPRYEVSEIVLHEVERFTEYDLRVRNSAQDPDATLQLEGKLTRLTYRTPAERSVLEVFSKGRKARTRESDGVDGAPPRHRDVP